MIHSKELRGPALQIAGDRLVQNTLILRRIVSHGREGSSLILVPFQRTGTNTSLLKEQTRRYQHWLYCHGPSIDSEVHSFYLRKQLSSSIFSLFFSLSSSFFPHVDMRSLIAGMSVTSSCASYAAVLCVRASPAYSVHVRRGHRRNARKTRIGR